MMIKLADWCKKHGIKYLTGYRWFKDGKMPVDAYQTDTGTILVSDENDVSETMETTMQDSKLSDSPMSQLINKTVEISKAGGQVEDLATFIISNFKLEKHDVLEYQARKPKMKPTKEMTENHFKKFMKTKVKPETNMFLVNENELDNVVAASEQASSIEGSMGVEFSGTSNFGTLVPATQENIKNHTGLIESEMSAAIQLPKNTLATTPKTYASVEGSAVFTRSLGNGGSVTNSTLSAAPASSVLNFHAPASAFMPSSSSFANSDYAGFPGDNGSVDSEFLNEVSEYRPVTYVEARALLKLNNINLDPLSLDRKAKQLCALDRDVFDQIVESAKTK